MTTQNGSKVVENTIPILGVKNLQESIRFYTETLEFKLDWRGEEGSKVCSVSRDRCPIMLSQMDDRNRNSWVWIGLEDDSLFETYKSKRVKVIQEPRNRPWAYEMKIEDIDGNVPWHGTGPRRDMPFAEH